MIAAEAEWLLKARDAQLPPAGNHGGGWHVWLVLGGRGSGKTRAGAEWASGMALGLPPFARRPCGHIALVGETFGDAREVMVDGPSGLLSVSRLMRPRYEATRRRLVWDNGAVASLYSSEDPDALRGPQFDAAWCDELAKWKHPQETWDMLQFGLRLGDCPRQVVTTTPRPVPLVKALLADEHVAVSRMRTAENADNLAGGFMAAVERRYAGTRLGRQELDGELVEDRPGALWSRERIEQCFEERAPPLTRIVVAVDPKLRNFFAYKGVDIFKPNLKEVREGLHIPLDQVTEAAMAAVHHKLQEQLGHRISFITLSEKGVYCHDENSGKILPSHIRNIADVSGAGDTVIAVAAVVYALTRDAGMMAAYSNIAGGLVCEEVGVVPVDKDKLLAEIQRLLRHTTS